MRKYAREWVEKYPSIAKLNEAIAGARRMGSPGTVEAYVKAIRKFVKFIGQQDPETALNKLQNGEVNAEKQADAFIDYALDKKNGLGYSHGTVRNFMFGVKKWYELNGVSVNWEKIELPTSTETSQDDRAPSKEELKVLLNHARARDRAVIYTDTSSGLRIGTLLSLTIGDVDLNYPDVARITVERKRGRKFATNRTGTPGKLFCTFITPEAKKALQQYFMEREAAGEKLGPDSPLIGDAFHKGQQETVEDYEKVWARLLRRAGLAQKVRRVEKKDEPQLWFNLHIHTLRKYFRSNCVGVDVSYRERWMGHKGGYLDESYFKAEEPSHLAEYRKAIPNLTVYATPVEQKNLVAQAMKAFAASYQGVSDEQLKKIDEIFARAKDVDEAIQEFRKFREEEPEKKPKTMHDGNGKYLVAHNEEEMIRRLHEGYSLIQSLTNDKYLLEIQ